ncbi:MAG TPA: hypothetical protein VF017_20140 [Thermoanaerobaculia bacterium]|nr:hypothetical protein [Thermoanaerobaculia bacterium]
MRCIQTLLVLALLAALPASPAAASDPGHEAALSSNGEIYLAQLGACRDLFPTCTGAAARYPVLAIDVLRPGVATERLLVPDTGSSELEGPPALVVEDSSQSLFVVWESRRSDGRSRVNLAWYRQGAWSAVVEVTGDADPLKGTPQVVITRDTYSVPDVEGNLVPHLRSVLHVAWWEQSRTLEQVFYTPIVLEDGTYLGANHVYNLSVLDPNPLSEPGAVLPQTLARAIRLEPGRDSHSVVVGFVGSATHRFLTFEIRVVLGELSQLAEEVRIAMETNGELFQPDSLAIFADRIRAHMIEIGFRLHPALLGYLADDLSASIRKLGGAYEGHLPAFAERIRAHMIEIGARSLGEPGDLGPTSETPGTVLLQHPSELRPGILHAIWLRPVANLPAPLVGAGEASFYLAADGRRAIVAWSDPKGGLLFFRESDEAEWQVARHLVLSETIDAELALRLVRQRIRPQ